MAQLTLILGVLATVVYLLDGFRFMLNEWRTWRNKIKKDGTWLSLLVCLVLVPAPVLAGIVETEKATDNFNTGGPALSGNWTTVTGFDAPQIVSQLVQPLAVNVNSYALYTGRTWANDQYSQISLVTLATASSRAAVAVVRGTTGSRTDYECFAYGPLGSTVILRIFKVVAGVATQLVTTGANQTVASTDVMKCRAYGSTIALFINDAPIISASDSTITTGSPGLLLFTSTGAVTDVQVDDWAGGEVTTIIQTFPAASCSYTDVNAAVALATHGDTVTIPACAQTNWTTQLSITQGITLQGAGEGVTTLGDNVTKNGSGTSSLMSFAVNTPNEFYLTGFTVVGVATDPSVNNKGHIVLSGTATTWRVHHVTLTSAQTSFIATYVLLQGLIDHVTSSGGNYQPVIIKTAGSGSYGDASWAAPLVWGGANAIYIEDSTFTDASSAQHGIDCFGGGRYVSRHNTFTNYTVAGSHGTENPRLRGCRQIEAYANSANWTISADRGSQVRGGTAVVYNNTITGSGTLNSMMKGQNFRDTEPFPRWGWCADMSITGITRSGSTATATTAISHLLASGTGVEISGAAQSEYNGIVTIANVGATSFDYTVSGTPATPATGTIIFNSPFDGNTVADTGYRCVDQPGAGTSDDLGDVASPPLAKVNNTLDPIYVWGNTYNAVSNNTVAASTHVVVNRDYYNDGTMRPGYTAYTYPHPLQSGGTTAAPSPVVIARVLRWMEVAAFVTGMGWHFRKPIMAVSLAVLSWTVTVGQFTPRAYDSVKSVSRESAVKVLTVFNHLTKQRD